MRLLPSLVAALTLCAPAAPAAAQTAAERPRVAVVVVTLDQVRQIQVEHGRATLAYLGDEKWGQVTLAEPALTPDAFMSCKDERADGKLDYCIRYYLTRAGLADAPPTVVIAFDDRPAEARTRHSGEMRVTCYGRGVVPADAAAQDTWLWPDSARMHGVNDWNRDRDALDACIRAAASEPWTGLRQPDPA
ncbi:hypothetical protein [Brevundimonas sp. Root1423]|uniref:hypothetical protein n=1 Tax=Brevundimonas sp. Root1423 TaxID=1736462 RepID=UPI0006FD2145|nr:hypothetical protein [Brevundimonas sp. Root1423]KQY89934.1 hypothetical protein ASD25_05305 [Brevundimonas sp. Root1423]